MRQNRFHIASRIVPLHLHAIRSTKGAGDVPVSDGRYSLYCKMAVGVGVIRRYRHFLRTPEEHILHVLTILTLLRVSGVTLKLKKCQFVTDTINSLVHVTRLTPPGRFAHNKRNLRPQLTKRPYGAETVPQLI